MMALATKPVFRTGRDEYCWDDVLLASVGWGEWAALERETREGLACLRHIQAGAAAGGASLPPSAEAWTLRIGSRPR